MKLINQKIPGSKYFSFAEAACFDAVRTIAYIGNIILMAKMMDEFREWWGKPIIPSSWFRTVVWNKLKGGATQSQHLEGKAIDFEVDNLTPELIKAVRERWEMICYKYEVTGAMFVYEWGIHLDCRIDTHFKFWDYR